MYTETAVGKKLFEIRKNDRGFRVGDYLCLQETREIESEDGLYTGNEIIVSVSFILAGDLAIRYGLQDGYCAMSLVNLSPQLQIVIKRLAYKWDDKLAILFGRQEGVNVVRELTKDWLKKDWEEAVETMSDGLTPSQIKIYLIRRAENWYDEEAIKETGMGTFEQQFEFEKWLGW